MIGYFVLSKIQAEGHPQPLKAGSATLHHGKMLHYTRGNSTERNRRAFIVNFRPIAMVEYERQQGYDHGKVCLYVMQCSLKMSTFVNLIFLHLNMILTEASVSELIIVLWITRHVRTKKCLFIQKIKTQQISLYFPGSRSSQYTENRTILHRRGILNMISYHSLSMEFNKLEYFFL